MSKHDSVHDETYRGCTIKLVRDDDRDSPREYDNLGTMFCLHNRYHLGDELDGWRKSPEPEEYLRRLVSPATAEQIEYLENCTDYKSYSVKQWEKVNAAIERRIRRLVADDLEANQLILDLYLYDHSGITISCAPFSCPWDSGRVGIIHCSLKDAQDNWSGVDKAAGWDATMPDWRDKTKTITLRQATTRNLKDEVATYDSFLTGDVVGFVAEDPDGEQIDSCWGFYPDDREGYGKRWDYPIGEAKAAIDRWHEDQDKESAEVQHWAERDSITTK